MKTEYSTREVGDILGVDEWRVRRLFEVGDVPEPDRFAGKRAIPRELIPDIVDALRHRRWLPNTANILETKAHSKGEGHHLG